MATRQKGTWRTFFLKLYILSFSLFVSFLFLIWHFPCAVSINVASSSYCRFLIDCQFFMSSVQFSYVDWCYLSFLRSVSSYRFCGFRFISLILQSLNYFCRFLNSCRCSLFLKMLFYLSFSMTLMSFYWAITVFIFSS